MPEPTMPPDCPATEAPFVAVPVKSSWKSREAWLFFASGALFVISQFFGALPEAFVKAHEWIPAVMQAVAGASSVVGFFVRLAKPDLVTGVPWLDKANAGAQLLTMRGER